MSLISTPPTHPPATRFASRPCAGAPDRRAPRRTQLAGALRETLGAVLHPVEALERGAGALVDLVDRAKVHFIAP